MPFIVKWPGKIQEGAVSSRTICFTDVFATMADITGSELPVGVAPDSYSFLSELTGDKEELAKRPPIVMESANGMMTIRSGDWKLINQLGSGGFSKPGRIEPGPDDPEGQLYNLVTDPGEQDNLYLKKPEIVERLKSEMEMIIDAPVAQ